VQGRPLLKDFDPVNPFGTPQNPVCDGYTPEQFSLLDWSKIDLTELYPDIEVMPMEDYENTINTRLQDHLNNLNLPTP
jgi:conjugal transfer mating pair stabilization protein TraN